MKMLLPVLLMLATGKTILPGEVKVKTLPPESREVLDYLPRNIVIAHRGTTYWAPEETEAAMRWARNIGADYLELDLQRTKDGVLIALHDVNLRRTTNVETVFPDRADSPVSEFTLEELRQLDAGSWFNKANPDRARKAFEGLDILTLEDVVRIAEGYRIVRDRAGKRVYDIDGQGRKHTRYEKDPDDNGNRPGIYPETKEPHLFPGMEKDLVIELQRLGWYHPDAGQMKQIPVTAGKVAIANSSARVILQTFSDESLVKLKEAFPRRIPTCFLLWLGNDVSDLKQNTPEQYAAKINFGIENGAVIMGPSIAGAPNHYDELLSPGNGELIYRSGMAIHPYSFDTVEQMEEYTGLKAGQPAQNRADGMFTNKSDMTIRFYQETLPAKYLKSNVTSGLPDHLQQKKKLEKAEKVLEQLGRVDSLPSCIAVMRGYDFYTCLIITILNILMKVSE